MQHIEPSVSRKPTVAKIAQIHVLDWYLATYPSDTKGAEQINPSWTFGDFLAWLSRGNGLPRIDTDIREVIFSKLAQLTSIPYTTIYDLWLDNQVEEPEGVMAGDDDEMVVEC